MLARSLARWLAGSHKQSATLAARAVFSCWQLERANKQPDVASQLARSGASFVFATSSEFAGVQAAQLYCCCVLARLLDDERSLTGKRKQLASQQVLSSSKIQMCQPVGMDFARVFARAHTHIRGKALCNAQNSLPFNILAMTFDVSVFAN